MDKDFTMITVKFFDTFPCLHDLSSRCSLFAIGNLQIRSDIRRSRTISTAILLHSASASRTSEM